MYIVIIFFMPLQLLLSLPLPPSPFQLFVFVFNISFNPICIAHIGRGVEASREAQLN